MSKMISIDKLIEDENNRKYGGTTELATVKSLGVLQPLLVTEKGDKYLVLDGHRRLLSAKACGLKKVPCEVVDREIAENCKLLSNLDRKNLSPYDQYIAMKELKDLGYETRAIGDIVGTSKYQTERMLRLGNLIPEFIEKLQSGAITMTQASEICLASSKIQQGLLEKDLDNWSAKDIRELVAYEEKGFSLSQFSDEFLTITDRDNYIDCLHCKNNPATDTLLFETCTKEESYCKNSLDCAWRKLQIIKQKHKAEAIVKTYYEPIWQSYLEEKHLNLQQLTYPYTPEPNENYENQIKVVDLKGNVYYMGGNFKRSDEEKSKEEKKKALNERIETDKKNIEECIEKAIDVFRVSNRKEPLDIMGAKTKLEILSLAHRLSFLKAWDDACGKDLTEALKKAGLLEAVEGTAEAKQEALESPATAEILLAIRFEVRMAQIFRAIKVIGKTDMFPPDWGNRMENVDKLHELIEKGQERFTIWPADKDKLEDADKSCMRFYDALESDIKKREALDK